MLAFSQTLDHLSVLVAAVAACVAVWFARETVLETRKDLRLRQLSELIVCVSRMRTALVAERLQDAEEQANVIISLALSIEIQPKLPNTTVLGSSDPLHSNPRLLVNIADNALDELRAALVRASRGATLTVDTRSAEEIRAELDAHASETGQ